MSRTLACAALVAVMLFVFVLAHVALRATIPPES